MAIFKVERMSRDHNLLDKLIYIRDPQASPVELTYTSYVSDINVFEEMMLIKKIYKTPSNNTLEGRQFFDYELSLPENESSRLNDFIGCVKEVTEFLSNLQGKSYQTISCIHTNTDNLHVHILMNNIDMLEGTRLNVSYGMLCNMKDVIDPILIKYGFEPILR